MTGKDIIILNQSDENIFVTDTLFTGGTISTTLFLSTKNYLSKSKETRFVVTADGDIFLVKRKVKICGNNLHCILSRRTISVSYEQIRANTLYKVFFALDEIEQSKLNYVFYYKDSIILKHEYDLESIKKEHN